MSNVNQDIAIAAVGKIIPLLGEFINYSCKGKYVLMNFENKQITLAQTYSNEMAKNLVDIFNGIKKVIKLKDDDFADQRTGKYKPYIITCVIEEAKRPNEYLGELFILMITSNIKYGNAYMACIMITDLLS